MVVSKIDESIEMACDDRALNKINGDPIDYAKSLVTLLETRNHSIANSPAMLSAAGPPIQKRIQRIVQPKGIEMKLFKLLTPVLFFAFALCTLFRIDLVAQEQAEQLTSVAFNQIAQQSADSMTHTVVPNAKVTKREKLVTMTYKVRDLFPAFQTGGPLFNNGKLPDDTLTALQGGGITAADFSQLIEAITGTIEPDSWHDLSSNTIQAFPPDLSLVISCPERCHAEIKELLEKLTQITKVTIEFKSRVLIVDKDHFLNDLAAVQKRRSNLGFSEFCDDADNEAIATFEEQKSTVYNGQEIEFSFAPKDGLELTPFQFGTTIHPRAQSTQAMARLRKPQNEENDQVEDNSKSSAQETRRFTPMPQADSTGVLIIKHKSYRIFNVSPALTSNRDSHRAFMIVHAMIHDKRAN